MRKNLFPCLAGAAILLLAVAFPLRGQQLSVTEQMVRAREVALASGAPGVKSPGQPYYGTQDGSVVNVHSWEFQAFDPYNAHVFQDGNSYRYFSVAPGAGMNFLAAPVNDIPSGAIIDFVSISDCIANDGDIFLGLWDGGYGGGSTICGVCNNGGNVTFLNTIQGCGEDSVSGLNYQYTQNYGHPLYILMLWSNTYDGSTKFNDMSIGYHRMVTPAPVSATFGDVPPGSFGFQYIEALAASGITGGCGGGNYCPNGTLTRAQMAVFIAKALGLHWPN